MMGEMETARWNKLTILKRMAFAELMFWKSVIKSEPKGIPRDFARLQHGSSQRQHHTTKLNDTYPCKAKINVCGFSGSRSLPYIGFISPTWMPRRGKITYQAKPAQSERHEFQVDQRLGILGLMNMLSSPQKTHDPLFQQRLLMAELLRFRIREQPGLRQTRPKAITKLGVSRSGPQIQDRLSPIIKFGQDLFTGNSELILFIEIQTFMGIPVLALLANHGASLLEI
jgi:hypothetical protein